MSLIAVPYSDSRFVQWSGDCTNQEYSPTLEGPSVTFEHTTAQTCDAQFDLLPKFLVSVVIQGGGTGRVTSNPEGISADNLTFEFLENQIVSLTVDPDDDSEFLGFAGDCEGDELVIEFTVVEALDCIVRIELFPVLTVTVSGTGTGGVTSQPAGISTPLSMTAAFGSGTLLTLTATVGANSVFGGWTGDCAGTVLSVPLTMGADKTCDARFDPASPNRFAFFDDLLTELLGHSFSFGRDVGGGATSVFVAAREGGTAVREIGIADPTNLTIVSQGSLCDGVTSVVPVVEPGLGPVLYGFSATSNISCYTQTPLGGAIGLINMGSTTGEAVAVPGSASGRFVTLFQNSAVLRIASGSPTVTIPISPVGQRACARYVAVNNQTLYVVLAEGVAGTSTENCNTNRGLVKIDHTTNTVTGSAVFGTTPRDPVISADGSTIYVPDFAGNVIHVVNTATMQVTRTIPVPGGPVAVALTANGGHLIVAKWTTDEIALVSLANDQIVATTSSRGRHPVALLMLPNNVVLVLNYGDTATSVTGVLASFGIVIP